MQTLQYLIEPDFVMDVIPILGDGDLQAIGMYRLSAIQATNAANIYQCDGIAMPHVVEFFQSGPLRYQFSKNLISSHKLLVSVL